MVVLTLPVIVTLGSVGVGFRFVATDVSPADVQFGQDPLDIFDRAGVGVDLDPGDAGRHLGLDHPGERVDVLADVSGPARVPPDPFDGPQEMSVAGGEFGAGGVRQLPDPSDADALRGVVHAEPRWLGPFTVHHVDVVECHVPRSSVPHEQLDAPVSGVVRGPGRSTWSSRVVFSVIRVSVVSSEN